jgi:hypothetical protein
MAYRRSEIPLAVRNRYDRSFGLLGRLHHRTSGNGNGNPSIISIPAPSTNESLLKRKPTGGSPTATTLIAPKMASQIDGVRNLMTNSATAH